MAGRDRIREALRLLAEEAAARLAKHPSGHLVPGEQPALDLRLTLPLDAEEERVAAAAAEAETGLGEALEDLLDRRLVFERGRIRCLHCESGDCEHAVPGSAREVFAGYAPNGKPRFVELSELLLERADERVGELYGERPGLVTHVLDEAAARERLLPAFQGGENDRHGLHGAVLAGWYRVPGAGERGEPIALSFAIVSAGQRRGRRRFGLNVVGIGPGGEPLEHLHDRLRSLPWQAPVRWAQSCLRTLRGPRPERLAGILGGLARRLERGERSSTRRTAHAESRHSAGGRPTRMALADLAQAGEEQLLVDAKKGTLVVLGDKGRCHFFNEAGKLVTSVRYPPQTIERRRERGNWRPADPEAVARLREATGQSTDADAGNAPETPTTQSNPRDPS